MRSASTSDLSVSSHSRTYSDDSSTLDDAGASIAELRDTYPRYVQHVVSLRFPVDGAYVHSVWSQLDDSKTVFEWADTVKLDIMESARDAYIVHPVVLLTRVEICHAQRVLQFYQANNLHRKRVKVLIVALVVEEGCGRLAQENSFEVLNMSRNPNFHLEWRDALAYGDPRSIAPPLPKEPPPPQRAPPPPAIERTWAEIFTDVGVPLDMAQEYERTCLENRVVPEQALDLTMDIMKELGMKVGHILKVKRWVESEREKLRSPFNAA